MALKPAADRQRFSFPVNCQTNQPPASMNLSVINFGGFPNGFEQFRKEPLTRVFSTVGIDEIFPALGSDFVNVVCFRLGGVVLPKFHPGVWVAAPFLFRTEWCSVGQGREHGATGEICANTQHLFRLGLGQAHDFWDGLGEDCDIISRILKCGVWLESFSAAREGLFDHGMFVRVVCPRDLLTGFGVHKQGSTGECPEVDAQNVENFLSSFGLGFHAAEFGKAAWERQEGARPSALETGQAAKWLVSPPAYVRRNQKHSGRKNRLLGTCRGVTIGLCRDHRPRCDRQQGSAVCSCLGRRA